MSERGSFCTEYINCDHCFEAAKKVLVSDEKYLYGVVLPGYSGRSHETGELTGQVVSVPIIAGKLGALYPGGELDEMANLVTDLEKVICHPVRLVVMADNGGTMTFKAMPSKK